MSDLSLVRTLTTDLPQYGLATASGDGATVDFEFPYAPVVTSTAKVLVNGTLKTVVTDYTIDEAVGLVTFGTAPVAGSTVTISARFTLLTDDQLNDLLSLNAGDDAVRLAAADALDIIASSEAMIQRKLQLLDMQIDGPALAKALRDHAATLRKLVFSDEFNESTFEIAEQVNLDDNAAWVERTLKDWLRDAP